MTDYCPICHDYWCDGNHDLIRPLEEEGTEQNMSEEIPCSYCGSTALPCDQWGFDPTWCGARSVVVDADNTVLPKASDEG